MKAAPAVSPRPPCSEARSRFLMGWEIKLLGVALGWCFSASPVSWCGGHQAHPRRAWNWCGSGACSPALVPSWEPPSPPAPCVKDELWGLGARGTGDGGHGEGRRRGCPEGRGHRALLQDGGTVSAVRSH